MMGINIHINLIKLGNIHTINHFRYIPNIHRKLNHANSIKEYKGINNYRLQTIKYVTTA